MFQALIVKAISINLDVPSINC